MARKKRKFEMNLNPADAWLDKMTLRDMKRECVVRGIEFEKILSLGVPGLSNWFRENFHLKTDHSRLDAYDEWWETEVKKAYLLKGEVAYLHPALRLGYVAEKDEDGTVIKRKRAKVIIAKKKEKRERTIGGLFSGTKKAYTFQLQKEGKSKEDVIKLVIEQFPEASAKSIGIWFNKSKKTPKKIT